MRTLVPGGASSVQLKSKAPLSWASADSRGFNHDGRRRFRVVVACGIRQHQRCIGNDGSTLAKPVMKCDFQMSIAFSAALVRCT